MAAGETPGSQATVTLAPDQTVDVDKIGGTTVATNAGNKSAGTLRVVVASDQTFTAATATQSADVAVDGTATGVTVLAANASRKAAIIENVGTANVRVNVNGSAVATTGIQLVPGASLILEAGGFYGCPTTAVKAIREGSVSSSVSVLEVA